MRFGRKIDRDGRSELVSHADPDSFTWIVLHAALREMTERGSKESNNRRFHGLSRKQEESEEIRMPAKHILTRHAGW